MIRSSLTRKHGGFTLIELMVVIVVVAIMASLVLMNINGVDQRKAMQARELLILDLKKINREANDQARVYALVVEPATDVQPFRYSLQEYQTHLEDQQSFKHPKRDQKTWMTVEEFKPRELPSSVSFTIDAQDYSFENSNNEELLGNQAPKLIWLGNGEVKPVNIQMYYGQQAVGDLIQVDYLGKVTDAS